MSGFTRWFIGVIAFVPILISLGCVEPSTIEEAAKAGDADAIAKLSDAGANINEHDADGYTALHWAAFQGNVKMAKALLDHHADIEAVDSKGATPLGTAIYYDRYEVARFLLDQHANVNARDKLGWTPLCYAADDGHDYGHSYKNASYAYLLIYYGADVNSGGKDSPSPLSIASGRGHSDIVKLLLEHGAK